jgi:hypothetical protein
MAASTTGNHARSGRHTHGDRVAQRDRSICFRLQWLSCFNGQPQVSAAPHVTRGSAQGGVSKEPSRQRFAATSATTLRGNVSRQRFAATSATTLRGSISQQRFGQRPQHLRGNVSQPRFGQRRNTFAATSRNHASDNVRNTFAATSRNHASRSSPPRSDTCPSDTCPSDSCPSN